jgi:hypothetical protein
MIFFEEYFDYLHDNVLDHYFDVSMLIQDLAQILDLHIERLLLLEKSKIMIY